MGKYKTKITEYGYELINKALSGDGVIITDDWYMALGTGELEPDFKTTRLNNIIFDKNSVDYPGIVISQNPNGRYAEIVLPESLHGYTITEIGLFDEKNRLVVCANTKIDCTERTDEGFDIDYRARISLNAVNKDVMIQFQGGTFQLLEEKGKKGGYAPLDNDAKVPLEHLPSTFTPFCFNSGPVDENGDAVPLELKTVIETIPAENEGEEPVQIKKKIITLKSPAIYTDGNGKTIEITEDLTLDVTSFEPGETYSLRVSEFNGKVSFFEAKGCKVYKQKNEPENPQVGDLWRNLSVAPELAYEYKAVSAVVPVSSESSSLSEDLAPAYAWQLTNQVEAGTYMPDNSGGGGKLMSNPYNFQPSEEKLENKIMESLTECLTRNDKAEIISWNIPDYDKEISIENIKNGFIYTPNTNGYIKINRLQVDGSAFLDIYKGQDDTGTHIMHFINNSQFNNTCNHFLIQIEPNQTYYIVPNNTGRIWISFVPCKGT